MVEVIHLDSCLLRGLLDPEDKMELRSGAIHLMNSSPGERFRVSILAVGEVMGLMGERRSACLCAEAGAELHRLLHCGRVDLYGIGKGTEVPHRDIRRSAYPHLHVNVWMELGNE